ncbi:MAG: RHS repeat-associated core domain-containing protein [Candidatus Eremiobacterota bacterium]
MGRFTTRDPIGYAGGNNVYAYCGNDPVNCLDPSGLNPAWQQYWWDRGVRDLKEGRHGQGPTEEDWLNLKVHLTIAVGGTGILLLGRAVAIAYYAPGGAETLTTVTAVTGNAVLGPAAGPAGALEVGPATVAGAPRKWLSARGELTTGKYTVDAPAMLPHTSGKSADIARGKSQFLFNIDAESLVLDAAHYADKHNLWVGHKAKVPVSTNVGVLGTTGELTQYVNVYRTSRGRVHGAPGNAP